MKKMKLNRFKFGFLFFPFLFFKILCNVSDGSLDTRDVTIRIEPANSVRACDKTLFGIGPKPVSIRVTIRYEDTNTNAVQNVAVQDISTDNNWNNRGDLKVTFKKLQYKSYQVYINGTQNCSLCCTIGSSTCSEPPSAIKNANLFFYGDSTIPESGNDYSVYMVMNQCDCRGC